MAMQEDHQMADTCIKTQIFPKFSRVWTWFFSVAKIPVKYCQSVVHITNITSGFYQKESAASSLKMWPVLKTAAIVSFLCQEKSLKTKLKQKI